MRTLVYVSNEGFETTSYDEKIWLEKNKGFTFREEMREVKKEETEKQREKRLAEIEKRRLARLERKKR